MLGEVRELVLALVEGRLDREEAFAAAASALPRLYQQEYDARWWDSAEDGLFLLCAAIESFEGSEFVVAIQDYQDWLDNPDNLVPAV